MELVLVEFHSGKKQMKVELHLGSKKYVLWGSLADSFCVEIGKSGQTYLK